MAEWSKAPVSGTGLRAWVRTPLLSHTVRFGPFYTVVGVVVFHNFGIRKEILFFVKDMAGSERFHKLNGRLQTTNSSIFTVYCIHTGYTYSIYCVRIDCSSLWKNND